MKPRELRNSTIVVVGATSGVGRATALSLASIGARLVVVSRTGPHVDEVVGECRQLGAEAVGVAADISKPADVDRIVEAAVARFGAIDTWINTAAALIVGQLHEQPVDQIEQLIATNVFGTTLTSRAAMTHFHSRQQGVLINVSSLLGVIPNPVVPTYAMSKFAICGLTLSLHQSTWHRSAIKVCTILPGPIDTPMFARAAKPNRAGGIGTSPPLAPLLASVRRR